MHTFDTFPQTTSQTYEGLLAEAQLEASYIKTDSARQLIRAFDAAHLPLSYEARDELTTEQDARYGNGYAWLTRELSKHIAGKQQGIITEPAEEWSDAASDYVRPPLDWSKLALTGETGADLIITTLLQVDQRDRGGFPHETDIPVSHTPTNVKRDGCKDVETYFVQSHIYIEKGFGPDRLEQTAIEGKQFWHKKLGGQTYLNLEEIKYNGIDLPPGCVFRKEEDGFVFLRVTGFAFELPKAQELFGRSITEWYQMQHGRQEFEQAFDAFATARDRIAAESKPQIPA